MQIFVTQLYKALVGRVVLISKPRRPGIKVGGGLRGSLAVGCFDLGTIPFISKYFECCEKAVSKNRYGWPRAVARESARTLAAYFPIKIKQTSPRRGDPFDIL